MTNQKKIDGGMDWTFADIDECFSQIQRIATEKFNLDVYPNQVEIIGSEQMLDAYCITPDHQVLKDDLRWVTAGTVKVGDVLLGFDEHGPHRSYRNAKVERVEVEQMPIFEVLLESGKVFRVTNNHQWLVRQQKGKTSVLQWRKTYQLRGEKDPAGYSPSQIPKVLDAWIEEQSKDAGWLAGIYDGEGNLVRSTLQAVNISQNDGLVLEHIKDLLANRNIAFTVHPKPRTSSCNTVRMLGTVADKLKFLGSVRPERLISKLSFDNLGLMKTSKYENVVSVTPAGISDIVKITTSTGTFVCDGYPMHNSSVGMPVYYSHWSFGKQFVKETESYKRGKMGLAYEIVINSNPCIAYLMEENTMGMQALVMAHACFGHNAFFKRNAAFKQWTDADGIIDYLVFAKNYITECEDKYGADEVSAVLDAAHALKYHSVDKYKRALKPSRKNEEVRRQERVLADQKNYNDIWTTIPTATKDSPTVEQTFPTEPEDNILYFIEKHAPNLPSWKKEILRIVRKSAQYFYPQMLTQTMNEGYATFWHYTILNEMYDEGLVTEGFMLEFLTSHTNVVHQRQFQSLNPYALGFAIYQDIKRICMNPTEEDKVWFPEWAGNQDWIETIHWAAANFKDESFILQYLSPTVIRKLGLFYILNDDDEDAMEVISIQNEAGYREVREKLAEQCNVNNRLPYIQITNVDVWGDRSIELTHFSSDRHEMDWDNTHKTLVHICRLWGYHVVLTTVDESGKTVDIFEISPDQINTDNLEDPTYDI